MFRKSYKSDDCLLPLAKLWATLDYQVLYCPERILPTVGCSAGRSGRLDSQSLSGEYLSLYVTSVSRPRNSTNGLLSELFESISTHTARPLEATLQKAKVRYTILDKPKCTVLQRSSNVLNT